MFEDFENAGYGPWTATGEAFGAGPAAGTLPGQSEVAGYEGAGLVNSFLGGDGTTGTLTSPAFTVSGRYINLLAGGGAHVREPGAGDGSPPPGTVFADFEGAGWGAGWTATGTFSGQGPAGGSLPGQSPVTGFEGAGLANTFFDFDAGTGTIDSPEFEIASDHINFLVGGGPHADTAVTLLVDGEVVRRTSGRESEALNWASWNVAELRGRTARIQILDASTGGWGHVLADHIMFSDEPARPRSAETAVNLIVDGEVVRTVSGEESERLDWVAWDVQDLIGREARIEIVDRNTGGWGHILVDQITFGDAPARSAKERSSWLDHGRDSYAAVSWNGLPGGRRVLIGWMNNWQYAGLIPTSPWRSAMTVPRELALRRSGDRLELVQAPVRELRRLRRGPASQLRRRVLAPGSHAVGVGARGTELEIEAEFDRRSARAFGLKVRVGEGEETVIGYDVAAAELFVDRTRSGDVAFSPRFPSVQRAPLRPDRRGRLRLTVLVDRSSVEVFAGDGRIAITDQIFPRATSDGVQVFAEGGSVKVESLAIRRLRSAW